MPLDGLGAQLCLCCDGHRSPKRVFKSLQGLDLAKRDTLGQKARTSMSYSNGFRGERRTDQYFCPHSMKTKPLAHLGRYDLVYLSLFLIGFVVFVCLLWGGVFVCLLLLFL